MPAYELNLQPTALRALRSLNSAIAREARSQERMATGLKFNRAADDPSIVGMVERLNSQRFGATMASRNINDAITMAQTADSGLSAALDKVQEIRELALTALNDTNSPADLDSLDQQMQLALEDLDRIRSTTRFNGKAVFANSSLSFQVGADYGNSLAMEFESFSFITAAQQALDEGAYQNSFSDVTTWLSALGLDPVNTYADFGTETVWADERLYFTNDELAAINTASANADPNDHAAYTLSYLDGGEQVASKTYTLVGPNPLDNFVTAVNADTASTGWSAALSPAVVTNRLAFDTTAIGASGRKINLKVDGGATTQINLDAGATIDDFIAAVNGSGANVKAVRDSTSDGLRLLSDGNELEVTVIASGSSGSPLKGLSDSGPGDSGHYHRGLALSRVGTDSEGLDIAFNLPSTLPNDPVEAQALTNLRDEYESDLIRRLNADGSPPPSVEEALSLKTTAGSEFVLSASDIMVDELAGRRGYYGAMQRRLDSALDIATEASLSAEDAQARLTQTDFAAETAEQAEAQLLIETSVTALSQFNANRSAVVSLLLNQSLGFSSSR